MNSLIDILKMIDSLTDYLKEKNFKFSREGYPIFTKDMFLEEVPEVIVPINHRKNKRVVNKKKTVICLFCGDIHIYRRLIRLIDEIDEYKEYMGVIGSDITVTKDMEIEWQRVIILLNQMIMAVFAVNGIKIILNTRTGSKETRDMFKYMPKNIIVASGFRGGTRKYEKLNYTYIAKILSIRPSQLLIYGKCHKLVLNNIYKMGIDCIVYPDFRELCKEVA